MIKGEEFVLLKRVAFFSLLYIIYMSNVSIVFFFSDCCNIQHFQLSIKMKQRAMHCSCPQEPLQLRISHTFLQTCKILYPAGCSIFVKQYASIIC